MISPSSDSLLKMTELDRLVDAYIAFKRAEGQQESTSSTVRYCVRRVVRECGFSTASSMAEKSVIDWFTKLGERDPETGKPRLSANTRKHYHQYFGGFCEWLVARKYLEENPCRHAPRAKANSRDRRKFRRAMTQNELERLILVARLRPLAEYTKTRLVGSKGKDVWKANPIDLTNIESLAEQAQTLLHKSVYRRRMLDGLKWSLAYRVAATTGFRWGEVISIRVGQLVLGARPEIVLDGSQTKNGDAVRQPIHKELAKDLAQWIADSGLLLDDLLLPLPPKSVKRFYHDLKAAGIEKVDERGRCLDIHALRKSFGTMLALGGVHQRMAMKLLRHSKPELTDVIYTDAEQLDTHPCLEAIPSVGTMPESSWDPSYKEQGGAKAAMPEPKPDTSPKPADKQQMELLAMLLAKADPETLQAVLAKLLGDSINADRTV